jgi:hypothetical protein
MDGENKGKRIIFAALLCYLLVYITLHFHLLSSGYAIWLLATFVIRRIHVEDDGDDEGEESGMR